MSKLVAFKIDESLHNEFKSKVAKLGLSSKNVLEKLIEEYVKNG